MLDLDLRRSREHAGPFYNTDESDNYLSNSCSQKWLFIKLAWHVILYHRRVGLHERHYSHNILIHIPVTKNHFLISKLLGKCLKETNYFHVIYPSSLKKMIFFRCKQLIIHYFEVYYHKKCICDYMLQNNVMKALLLPQNFLYSFPIPRLPSKCLLKFFESTILSLRTVSLSHRGKEKLWRVLRTAPTALLSRRKQTRTTHVLRLKPSQLCKQGSPVQTAIWEWPITPNYLGVICGMLCESD